MFSFCVCVVIRVLAFSLSPYSLFFLLCRPEWQYKGMIDCVVRVYKEEGILAYWKGTHAVFWRNSICMLGMVGFYNTVEHCLPTMPFKALCTGALCGIIGSFMSYPFEMLRCV